MFSERRGDNPAGQPIEQRGALPLNFIVLRGYSFSLFLLRPSPFYDRCNISLFLYSSSLFSMVVVPYGQPLGWRLTPTAYCGFRGGHTAVLRPPTIKNDSIYTLLSTLLSLFVRDPNVIIRPFGGPLGAAVTSFQDGRFWQHCCVPSKSPQIRWQIEN